MARRDDGRSGGGAVWALLILLALLGGYGTWNFQRNVAAEAREVRPYRGYSDADLAALEAAYRAEVDVLNARYSALSGRRQKVADQGFGQAQVDEFERIQRASRSVRELGYEVSQQQATLEALVAERERRAGRDAPWLELVKRVFYYRA